MKKFFVFLSALCLVSVGVASAQKVDEAGILKKIAKSDEAIANEKKAAKAATWLDRAAIYYQAANEPTKSLYWGGNKSMMTMSCGDVKGEQVKVNKRDYIAYDYPYFTAYVRDNKIVAWKNKKEIKENALDVALEAYVKAYDLDFETAPKVQAGLSSIMSFYRQMGNVYNELGESKLCADLFVKANDIQHMEIYGSAIDPMLIFFAGYMHVINASTDPASYVLAEKYLKDAVDAGYCDIEDKDEKVADIDRGSVYYYLYYSAYMQKDADPKKLEAAKEYLKAGLSRYPRNENIFDGLLQLYTTQDGVGDPTELLGNAEESIKLDPKNVNAWFGRGRIYYAAKNLDEAFKSFEKVISIDPKMFASHYYLGVVSMQKAEEVYNEIKDNTYTDRAKYNEDMGRLNGAYAKAIPHFERAHNLKKDDRNTLSYLKQLCFRLRDEEGMMAKYEKYNALFNSLNK